MQSVSEDFSDISQALSLPLHLPGGSLVPTLDPYSAAEATGRIARGIPVNRSPVTQPTLDAATEALVVVGLAYLDADG